MNVMQHKVQRKIVKIIRPKVKQKLLNMVNVITQQLSLRDIFFH